MANASSFLVPRLFPTSLSFRSPPEVGRFTGRPSCARHRQPASPSDCQQRQVIARLDDGPRVQLLFGESATLELQPGAHRLHLHNTLMWKNIHFTIEPGEHLEFIAINYAYWWTYGIVGVLGSAPLFLKVYRRTRR